MKTQAKLFVSLLTLALYSTVTFATTFEYTTSDFTNHISLKITVENTVSGVYEGHDETGYNFSITDEKGATSITTFSELDEAISKSNDLDSDAAIGITYEITYKITENGDKVITALKPQS